MKFSVLILTVGIPGAGKSTWVKNYLKQYPLTFVISTDEIRKELFGSSVCNPLQSEQVHDEARKRVKNILDDPNSYDENHPLGPTIVVDSTNCAVEEWQKYKRLGATLMAGKYFNVNPEEAMKHQITRKRIVPLDVLQQKWKKLQQDKIYFPCFFNIIF